MEKDDSGSIFDRASELSKKKRLLKKKKVKPSSSQSGNARSSAKSTLPDEFREMFDKMRQMREDLEGKMHEIYTKVGVSRAVAEQFFADPKNISESKKAEIDSDINKLEGQLVRILGPGATKVAKEFKSAKEGEKRKTKSIGQRRKWIQM